MLSARRSYLQFVFELVGLPIRPDYWDYQWKINHTIDAFNSISFIGLGSIDDFSVVAPEEFDAEQQSTIEQVPIIKQKTNTVGLSWKRKFKNEKGRMQTTLSTNRLQNVFSRFSDNENKRGLFSKMMPLNKKQNYGFTLPSLLKIGSLAMAQTFNVLTIPTLL